MSSNNVISELYKYITDTIEGFKLLPAIKEKITAAAEAAYQNAKELKNLKTNIQMSTGASDLEIDSIMDSYHKLAMEISSTTKATAESGAAFLRMGKSISEANEMIRSSEALAKIGMLETNAAVDFLTDGMNGYEISAAKSMDIVDRLTAVGTKSEVAVGGLAEAMSQAAESANAGGTSMDRLIGYIAAVGENSDASMKEVGNSFKNIYERMDSVKSGQFGAGADEGLNDMEEVLSKLGVSMRDSTNQYRDFDDVLDDVGARWNELSQKEQNALSVAVAGNSQRESFIALMDNYSSALQYSGVSSESAGAALQQYGIYQDTIEAKTNELTTAFEALSGNMFGDEATKGILVAATRVVELVDKFQILKGTLAGLATMEFLKFTTGALAGANSLRNLTAAFGMLKLDRTDEGLKRIGGLCKGLSDQQLKLVLSTKGLGDAQRITCLTGMNLTEAEAAAKLEAIGLGSAEMGATQATFSLSGAMESLKTAFLSNPIGVIIMGITAAVSVATAIYSKYKKDQEDLRQAAQEAANTFSEESQSIDDYIKKYQELHNELINTNTAIERQQEIKKELLDLQKEMNEKYGEEYGKVSLLTTAYEDQTAAMKKLRAESAREFLDTTEGLDVAEAAMTKDDYAYSLGAVGDMSTQQAKETYKIAEKYQDKGIALKQFTGGTYLIEFKGDPLSAKKVISDFKSEISELQEQYEGNRYLHGILTYSREALIQNKEILDKNEPQYREKLKAEINSNSKLSDARDSAEKAVANYNKEIVSGNESAILKAVENLKQVRDTLGLTEKEVKRYGPIFDEIFSRGDMNIYDFKAALSDTSSEVNRLATAVSDIRRNIDSKPLAEVKKELDTMSQDGSLNLTARREIDSSELTQAGWGEVKTRKETLFAQRFSSDDGSRTVVVTPILPDGTVLSPNELAQYAEKLLRGEEIEADVKIAMFDSDYSETEAEAYAEKLQKLTQEFYNDYSKSNKAARDIKMDETEFLARINAVDENSVNNPFSQLKKYAKDCGMSVEQVAKELVKFGAIRKEIVYENSEPLTYDQTLDKLDTLTEPLKTMGSVYSKFMDKDSNVGIEALSELNNKFKDVDGIGDYIRNIEEARGETEKTQQAFDDLTNAYLKQTGILDIVDEGNQELIADTLTEMGVTNANILVQQALAENLAKVEAQKYMASDASFDLSTTTEDEINGLVNESIVSQEACTLLARLALEKDSMNKAKIETSDDIDRLIGLANAAGVTKEVMDDLNRVKDIAANIKQSGIQANIADIVEYSALVNSINSGNYEWKFKPLDPADFKVSGSNNEVKGRGSSEKKQFSEEINHIDRALEVSKRRLQDYKNALEDALTIEEKDAAIDDIVKETQSQMEQMTKVSKLYADKAAEILAQIPENIRDKVKNGSDEIENLNDENVSKLIKQFYDLDASANDADGKVRDLKNSIHDMKMQKIQIQIEGLERTKSKLERLQDQYETAISAVTSSVQSEIDEVNSYYDSQIANVQKQIDALDEQNDKLEVQRNLEEALYNLRRAENQRTNRIYREGQGFVYEADQDAVREAQESYDSAELDKTKYDLEQIIDRLEEERSQEVDYLTSIKDTWEGIADSFERMADMRMAEELFGTDSWLEDILNGDTDLFDEMQENFGNVFEGIFNTDQVIESLNDLKDWVENGEMSDDTALAVMNQQLSELGENAAIQSENMGEGFTSIYTSAENAKTLSADTYAAWTENLRLFQEETLPICEGLITQFNNMADAVVLAAERARQAAADMESLGGGDGGEGVTTTKEPIRSPSSSGGPGVKHHKGILNGTNGNPNTEDKRVRGLRILSTEPLKSNEVPIIALDDEVSLTREQQEMALRNFQTAMAPRINLSGQAYSMIQPIKQEPSSVEYNFSGGIHITEAQNVTDIARGVKAGMLKQALDQELYKR